MLFNSIEFLLFLPIVFTLYWFVVNKSLNLQNLLILVSSYVFYGWWDYRFLSLIILSTIVDFYIGLRIFKCPNNTKRKVLLWFSVLFNIGILGFFKYFNFFIDSWIELFGSIGYEIKSIWTLNIILPVGISFYTFQTMSYTIDIYRKNLEPTKDFISFASFVAFFPQLVAGPIERATNLIPQILNKRIFNYQQCSEGLRLIVWGMFKKVVIADSLAPTVDQIFDNYHSLGGGDLWLGSIYFAFQIYCDFSGYSDIAIGTSKLFGFELRSNFRFPYFSRNIGEFWRRWHISLSTWFRDYLYIPLGGSKKGKWNSFRNIIIIFLVSGFWHGANLTFIIWGLIHSLFYLPLFVFKTNRKYLSTVVAENSIFPSFKELYQIGFTFFFVTIAWVFFRSNTVGNSIEFLTIMFTNFNFPNYGKLSFLYIILLILLEWNLRFNERIIKVLDYRPIMLFISVLTLFYFINSNSTTFIYFQF